MTPHLALVAFALVTLIALGIEIMFTYAAQGFLFGFSANRPDVEHSPLARRIKNAYRNQVESAAYGVPVLAAAALIAPDGPGVHLAALIFVIGRAAFVLLYYTGISFIRVPAFLMGTLSIFYISFVLIQVSMS